MFAAAALWSSWKDPNQNDESFLTVAMVTTEAVGELARIHHRMPLLLTGDELSEWLDPEAPLPAWASSVRTEPEVDLVPVSKRVNSVRNNDATNVEPIDLEVPQDRLF
jgi:putative SOS response-associated peptidase YedK